MSSNRTDLHFLVLPYSQICNLLDVLNLPPRSKEDVETKDGGDDLSIKFLRKNAWPKGLNGRTSAVVGSAPSDTDLLSREIGILQLSTF